MALILLKELACRTHHLLNIITIWNTLAQTFELNQAEDRLAKLQNEHEDILNEIAWEVTPMKRFTGLQKNTQSRSSRNGTMQAGTVPLRGADYISSSFCKEGKAFHSGNIPLQFVPIHYLKVFFSYKSCISNSAPVKFSCAGV